VDSLNCKDAAIEVFVGHGRILTLKADITEGNKGEPLIAVGDPTVADFRTINIRQLRITGYRVGTTDLSITTARGQTYSFEIRVVIDLDPLRAQLRCLFPDASLKLCQLRDQVVVEGQARDQVQVNYILEAIRAYLYSMQISQGRSITAQAGPPPVMRPVPRNERGEDGLKQTAAAQIVPVPGIVQPLPYAPGVVSPYGYGGMGGVISPELVNLANLQSAIVPLQVLNLIRVPGAHQVLLKVRVAELNRTALRQIGADLLAINPRSGAIVGTQIGGAAVSGIATATGFTNLMGLATSAVSPSTTLFGIFQEGDFAVLYSALRSNNLLKVLAEPNLVALNGQVATFLAGGEFPVPVPQFGAGAGAATVTVQFKQFGVQLGFLPFILDDGVIRLTVDPEVSQIDRTIAATLVPGGTPVPGLSARRTHTTVELRHGETLMVSGLLQLTLAGNTNRIPGLGDLPVIGPFFSNTTSTRTEKELVILVTPYLIEPMHKGQVPPTPGDEVLEPNDIELYFLNRIEARNGRDFRATTKWDDPFHIRNLIHLQSKQVCGESGFTGPAEPGAPQGAAALPAH
jgi:pilus assembly protein CpaC